MDSIKVLEEIGLYKVSQDTHIEQKYLRYMVDGDFDKLNRINTLGFVKILSREYNLDLSDWVEVFEDYWIQNRLNLEEDDKLFIVIDSGPSKAKKIFIFFVITLFVVIAGIGYSVFTKENSYSSNTYVSPTFSETPVVKETQEEINKLQEEQEANTVQQIVEPKQEEILDVAPQEETNATQEAVVEESSAPISSDEQNISNTDESLVTQTVSEVFDNQAVITPKTKLWVGVIYLDNFKRRSYLGEGNFSIDLSRDQIITTGHGSFKLEIEGESMEFSRQSPIRFQVENTQVKEISWSRFKELNRGNSW
jgi:hypothetical protein